jgi:Saxitoxin biosynthesis operon protein SxtJ
MRPPYAGWQSKRDLGTVVSEASSHHELGALNHHVEGSSDRSFGLVFAAVFALIAAYAAWHGGKWWPIELALSAAFLGVALTRPSLLAPLNRWWTKLGLLLGAIVAPVVMGLVYFGLITPLALIARLVGKDFLRLKREPAARTYWLARTGPPPARDSLRDQF